ncbi:MAG TPA: hypothetical protein PLJ67_09475, partial [Giesbergeria sp.]|nr:hypothetical protein [Giesbergeria sp.]
GIVCNVLNQFGFVHKKPLGNVVGLSLVFVQLTQPGVRWGRVAGAGSWHCHSRLKPSTLRVSIQHAGLQRRDRRF